MKKFDPSNPRQMFWANDVGGKSHCPQCFSKLENESQVFLMAIRDAHDIYSSIVGNDAGYFCPKCPTIVLDGDTFAEFAQLSHDGETEAEFTVLGLVDLKAIPNDKRSLPLGGDDNPIPLVSFTNIGKGKPKKDKIASRRKKKKRVKRNKRR